MIIIAFILFCVYAYYGGKANTYCRIHILGQVAVLYSDTIDYILHQFVWAVFLGWITIPIMLIMKALNKDDAD